MVEYLIAHVLGDFYLQSESLSKVKKGSVYGVIIHCIVYGCVFVAMYGVRVIQRTQIPNELIMVGALIVLHAGVDIMKYYIYDSHQYQDPEAYNEAVENVKTAVSTRMFKNMLPSKPLNTTQAHSHDSKYSVYIFCLDQLIHIGCIISVFDPITTHNPVALTMLCFLLLGKPANIMVRSLISPFDPKNEETQETTKEEQGFSGAGERIGSLERMLMMIILITTTGNYAGIAIVLTLKTIARYAKISQDAKFAEYFVIGSLTSLLIVILVYLAFINAMLYQ